MRSECPGCHCPFFDKESFYTADNPRPWKDEDGTWYNGPASENIITTCKNCGWKETKMYKRGKLIETKREPDIEAGLNEYNPKDYWNE